MPAYQQRLVDYIRSHKERLILLSLVVYILSQPVNDYFKYSDLTTSIPLMLGIIANVGLWINHRYRLGILLCAFMIWFITQFFSYISNISNIISMIAIVVIIAFSLDISIVKIMKRKYFAYKDICSFISLYLSIGIFYSIIYYLIHIVDPASFINIYNNDKSPFVYFSFETLTTVGFGDILPSHNTCRILVASEAIVGQFYTAIVVARSVSLLANNK